MTSDSNNFFDLGCVLDDLIDMNDGDVEKIDKTLKNVDFFKNDDKKEEDDDEKEDEKYIPLF